MKTFLKITLAVCLMSGFALNAQAQKKVSEEDKKRIVEIFKDVDPSQYRLMFEDGEQTFGKKRIKMSDLKMTGKMTQNQAAGVKWTFVTGDRSANEVIYVYTEGMSKMASLLGKEKFKALQDIVSRYPDVPNIR